MRTIRRPGSGPCYSASTPGAPTSRRCGPMRLRDAATGAAVPALVRRYPPEDVVNARNYRVEFAAHALPPLSHRVFHLEKGAEELMTSEATSKTPSAAPTAPRLETPHFL